MRIKIEGEDYRKCEEASHGFWSNSKSGFFGRGLINSKNDPARVTRIGILGEVAVGKYLGVTANLDYIKGGDSEDFLINGYQINVKTAAKDYGAALIRCRSEKGRTVFKPADVFIAAVIEKEDRDAGFAWVCLKGWETLDFVRNLPETPARVGNHFNYELKFGEIRGIGKLKGFLKKAKVKS